jgi:hypothetical protein
VIDVQQGKEKGYETLVKEGLCDEVRPHVDFFIMEWCSVLENESLNVLNHAI